MHPGRGPPHLLTYSPVEPEEEHEVVRRAYCSRCGTEVGATAAFCQGCGARVPSGPEVSAGWSSFPPGTSDKSRVVAGVLGVTLGGFGVHRFYLGFTTIGILQIVVTVVTCGIGALWGFIEGIVILCGGMNEDSRGLRLRES